jgi:small-conductance mechanosensitive channel
MQPETPTPTPESALAVPVETVAAAPSPSTLAERLRRLVDATEALAVDAAILVVVATAIYLPGRYLLVPAARRVMDAVDVEDTYELSLLKLLHAGVVVVALVVGTNLSGLASFLQATEAVVAAATIALGFAAQDVLGNLVSGVFIVLDPKYEIGDWIQWNDREGIIEDISFRVTRLHTFDNELISVPNGELTTNAVINPVAKDELRVTYTFCVGYGSDLDRARKLAVDVARADESILDRPAPVAQVMALGDSCIELQTRFWIADPARTDFVQIRSRYVEAVMEAYEAAGIDMPYPTQRLTGRVETGPAPARTPGTDSE